MRYHQLQLDAQLPSNIPLLYLSYSLEKSNLAFQVSGTLVMNIRIPPLPLVCFQLSFVSGIVTLVHGVHYLEFKLSKIGGRQRMILFTANNVWPTHDQYS